MRSMGFCSTCFIALLSVEQRRDSPAKFCPFQPLSNLSSTKEGGRPAAPPLPQQVLAASDRARPRKPTNGYIDVAERLYDHGCSGTSLPYIDGLH